MPHLHRSLLLLAALCAACDDDAVAPDDAPEDGEQAMDPVTGEDRVPGVTEASEVDMARARDNALPKVFIPPYQTCADPNEGEPAGAGEDGKVCTQVSIAGATEPGRAFIDYGDCEIVRTQRPYWPKEPAGTTNPDDPRLRDEPFLSELAWVTEQVRATGCTCCHDASAYDGQFAQWDISHEGIWTDTASDSAIALFTGLADSSVLGAYPPADNNGFDREKVGLPSTDPARMKAFFVAELARRGLTEDDARAVPPFGGPIYQNQIAKPAPCEASVGVAADTNAITWKGAPARYVYVLEEGADNPGVPPNLDKPAGTLFRLDALPSAQPIASGVTYGETPEGTFQMLPEAERAPALEKGTTYHLFVEADMGFVTTNCLFTY